MLLFVYSTVGMILLLLSKLPILDKGLKL